MHLRANVRPPGRYREDTVEDLPPNPRFVVPTIPFNPNLRPAVFPTLRWDELPFDHPNLVSQKAKEEQVQVEENEGTSEVAESPEIPERLLKPQKPAVVFRDTRTVPIMEQGDDLVQGPDRRWTSALEPSQFDPYAVDFDDDEGEQRERDERWFLPVLTEQKYWVDLSNGMKLIIIRELTDHMTFEDTVLSFLQLGEKELEDFLNLCADEVKIRALEKETVARIQARQMALLDSGERNLDGDESSRIYAEEMARAGDKMPATWLISREDVATAKNFLGNYRFREEFEDVPDADIEEVNRIPTFAVLSEIQDRLELYMGVATKFEELDFGEDFMGYLPLDVPVVEQAEDGEVVRAAEVPTVADRESESFNLPPMGTFKTSTPNRSPGLNHPKEKATTKSPKKKDIERDGINNELLKKRGKGRPRKKDKIVKAPSRLREVTNAEDLRTPRQSPTIGNDAVVADGTPFSPDAPTTSIQNLGRSPFKEFSSASPPPKHSASFPTTLPGQPALTSPPKDSSRSNDSVDAGNGSSASAPSTKSAPYVQESVEVSELLCKNNPIPNVQDSLKNLDVPGKKSSAANVPQSTTTLELSGKDSEPSTNSLAVPKPSISSVQRSIAELAKSQYGQASPPNGAASAYGTNPITTSIASFQASTPSNSVQQVGQRAVSNVSAHKRKASGGSPQSSRQNTPKKLKLNVKGAQGSRAINQPGPSATSRARRDDDEADATLQKESPAKRPRIEQPYQAQQGVINSIIGGVAKSIGKKFMNPFKGGAKGHAKVGDPSGSGMVDDSEVRRESQVQTPTPVAAKLDNLNPLGPAKDLDVPADAFVLDPSKTKVEVQIPAPKRTASEASAGTSEEEGPPAKKLKNAPAAKRPAAQPRNAQPKAAPQPRAAKATKDTKAATGKAAE